MSQNTLYVIPTEPNWMPDELAAARGAALFRDLAPRAQTVESETYDTVTFVDCGGNYEGTFCPSCAADVPVPWWQAAMDVAFASEGRDLEITMPCCATATTLNNLDYHWPMGFAHWALVAREPDRFGLEPSELLLLEAAIGHALKEIWRHI